MRPMGPPHATALSKTSYYLYEVFGSGYVVRSQMPLRINDDSEPEPDVLVVAGAPDDYKKHPVPSEALLLVEISDATYRYDQGLKADIYAASGIVEYWIVNLRQRTLEIRRDPRSGKYQTLETYGEIETVIPLAAPNAALQVASLLPLARKRNEG